MSADVQEKTCPRDLQVRDKSEADALLAQSPPLTTETVRQTATKFGLRVAGPAFDEWLRRERADAVAEHLAGRQEQREEADDA